MVSALATVIMAPPPTDINRNRESGGSGKGSSRRLKLSDCYHRRHKFPLNGCCLWRGHLSQKAAVERGRKEDKQMEKTIDFGLSR